MATNISLVTYAGQTVTPLDDALIYETSVDNGIFDGCECTLSGGNTIHMNGGHGIICGRKFTVYESDTAVPLSSGGTLNGRMKVHLDLADTGEPIQFIIETAASLPALVQQDDVNVNNGVYEFEMCAFNVSETAVTNFTQVFEQAYSATREISTFSETTAQLASTDKILVQKANGDTYSMSYSALINSLAATLITRSGTVTDAKHALSAAENNPNVSNSLAAKIASLNSSIANLRVQTGAYTTTSTGISGNARSICLQQMLNAQTNLSGNDIILFACTFDNSMNYGILVMATAAVGFFMCVQTSSASIETGRVVVGGSDCTIWNSIS